MTRHLHHHAEATMQAAPTSAALAWATNGAAASALGLLVLALGGWDKLLWAVAVAALTELAVRSLALLSQWVAQQQPLVAATSPPPARPALDVTGLFIDLIRHLASVGAIVIANLADGFLGNAGVVRTMVCMGLVGVSGAAVLGHLDTLGLPVSAALVDAVRALLSGKSRAGKEE